MNAINEAHSALAELRRAGGRLRMDGAKLIVDWARARIPALADRLRAAKPELMEIIAAKMPEATTGIVADALRIFNGRIIPDEDDLDPDMSERLAMINKVLEQRDEKARVAFTRTEVESCAIGLRQHAGSHPAIDTMLARLNAAKKSALPWQTLAARM